MQKFVENFMFGLAFGCGFLIAYAVLKLVGALISGLLQLFETRAILELSKL